MAKTIRPVIGSSYKKMSKMYGVVGGVYKNIPKGYIVVDGVYKLVWGGDEEVVVDTRSVVYHDTISNLSSARMRLAATTVGDYALFAGGNDEESDPTNKIDVYNSNLTKKTSKSLSIDRTELVAVTIGDYALFAQDLNTESTVVDVVDSSLTTSTASELNSGQYGGRATTVSNYALIGGGGSNNKTVTAYDTNLVKFSVEDLGSRRYHGGATTIGDYALFAGGTLDGDDLGTDVYDISLTRTNIEAITVTDGASNQCYSASSISNYAFFPPCSDYNGVTNIYDTSLTKTTVSYYGSAGELSSSTHLGDYVLIMGFEDIAHEEYVNIYDKNLTCKHWLNNTGDYKCFSFGAATTIGDYALFGGGSVMNTGISKQVVVFTLE